MAAAGSEEDGDAWTSAHCTRPRRVFAERVSSTTRLMQLWNACRLDSGGSGSGSRDVGGGDGGRWGEGGGCEGEGRGGGTVASAMAPLASTREEGVTVSSAGWEGHTERAAAVAAGAFNITEAACNEGE